jgi:serine/threonine-protein kinase
MTERVANRYALIRLLGRGGMGEVFLARDLATGAECALKRLRADAVSDRSALSREFELLTRLRHPSVVEVLELGYAPDGTAWYTMQYVPGVPADLAIAAGWYKSIAFVAVELAHGLEALHSAGIVHGDLKPSNVLIIPAAAETGPDPPLRAGSPVGVRIVDFGLAALVGNAARRHVGTAGFAAPEVVRHGAPTMASDLYNLGATLYALIAGRPAFEGANTTERLRRQAEGPPPARPLEESGAPATLVSLLLRLMAEAPGAALEMLARCGSSWSEPCPGLAGLSQTGSGHLSSPVVSARWLTSTRGRPAAFLGSCCWRGNQEWDVPP